MLLGRGYMASFEADILILCKTYPSPSGKHVETSCVAGMTASGELLRIFPVPFRLVDGDRQFKKWQWITARIERAKADKRSESHKIFVDTIRFNGDPLPTGRQWTERRAFLDRLKIFDDFDALENHRIGGGATLGMLRPTSILGLDITPAKTPDWTDDEKAKLLQSQRQGGLFDNTDAKSLTTLKKLPFDFHYRYACEMEGKRTEYRHKIADWEAGALFWNCFHRDKRGWEAAFRKKMMEQLPAADLMFLMGTIHRFPDQWLIVSLIYPPKRPPAAEKQMSFEL